MILFVRNKDDGLLQLNGTLTEVGNGKGQPNAQLKIYKDDSSNKLYANIPYDHIIAVTLEGTEFHSYFYQGKDDEGYIFQSSP